MITDARVEELRERAEEADEAAFSLKVAVDAKLLVALCDRWLGGARIAKTVSNTEQELQYRIERMSSEFAEKYNALRRENDELRKQLNQTGDRNADRNDVRSDNH